MCGNRCRVDASFKPSPVNFTESQTTSLHVVSLYSISVLCFSEIVKNMQSSFPIRKAEREQQPGEAELLLILQNVFPQSGPNQPGHCTRTAPWSWEGEGRRSAQLSMSNSRTREPQTLSARSSDKKENSTRGPMDLHAKEAADGRGSRRRQQARRNLPTQRSRTSHQHG